MQLENYDPLEQLSTLISAYLWARFAGIIAGQKLHLPGWKRPRNIPGRCIIFIPLWGTFFYRALQYSRPFIPQPPFHLVNLVVNMEAATHSKIYKKRRNSWNSAFKGLQKMDCLHIPKKKWAVVWFWGNLQFKYWTEALLQKKSKLEMLKLLLSLDRSCDLKKDQI